jgi:hypothetical protein
MAIVYSKNTLIERIKRHFNNDFPNTDFKVSDAEILLYIDAAIPFVMKGQMFENAKVTGVLEVPEAYLVTYLLSPITRNAPTNEWKATLPQTPLALPSGYAITDVYVSTDGQGRGQSFYPTTTKRVPYRDLMPKPSGAFYRVNGNIIYLQASNGMPLNEQNVYVELPISRTDDANAVMPVPDSAIEGIFQSVVNSLMQRYQFGKDNILDNEPKNIKTQ